jgi:hypothetical protein
MTLQEFRAWFDGFTENMSEIPTKLQWDRIKSRVKEIDHVAITYPVYIERYWRNVYPQYLHPHPHTYCSSIGHNGSAVLANVGSTVNVKDDGHAVFNSPSAMYELGANEYSTLRG